MIRWLMLVCLALFGCDGCAPSVQAAQSPSGASITDLRNATVALVMPTKSGMYRPFCTGVWISVDTVLTAAHCVDDMVPGSTVDVASFGDVKAWGGEAYIASAFKMKRTKLGKGGVDLALIMTTDYTPAHQVTELAPDTYDGQNVSILGMTNGYLWNLVPGTISATRVMEVDGTPRKVLHITTAAYFGNSGGGAFDIAGRLVGICSFLDSSMPDAVFFVTPDVVRKFVQ